MPQAERTRQESGGEDKTTGSERGLGRSEGVEEPSTGGWERTEEAHFCRL